MHPENHEELQIKAVDQILLACDHRYSSWRSESAGHPDLPAPKRPITLFRLQYGEARNVSWSQQEWWGRYMPSLRVRDKSNDWKLHKCLHAEGREYDSDWRGRSRVKRDQGAQSSRLVNQKPLRHPELNQSDEGRSSHARRGLNLQEEAYRSPEGQIRWYFTARGIEADRPWVQLSRVITQDDAWLTHSLRRKRQKTCSRNRRRRVRLTWLQRSTLLLPLKLCKDDEVLLTPRKNHSTWMVHLQATIQVEWGCLPRQCYLGRSSILAGHWIWWPFEARNAKNSNQRELQ